MLRRFAALWLLILSLGVWAADATVPIPRLEARVTDLTGTLTGDQQTQLGNRLASLERDKGAQIAILLLPTTQPESIEAFGIRLAEAWKIGRKGVDDGIIVIVAKNDRTLRIEVGYGLEAVIPDAIAKRIIEETIMPHFRQGNFFDGLSAGSESLGRLIAGEALPEAAPGTTSDDDIPLALLFLAAILAPLARILFGMTGSVLAAAIAGYLAYTLVASWVAAFMAALVVFLVSLGRMRGSGGRNTGGSGGSSGSSGGFSGGGGSFGGGGASGKW